MQNFYSRLSYSFGNEDWQTEHKALRIQPNDTVLCVTASGDRPLNLLTKELKEIVAVDANPLQNALFDLKRVAIEQLDFPEYLAFIGAQPSNKRLQTYAKLSCNLDPLARAFWGILLSLILNGKVDPHYFPPYLTEEGVAQIKKQIAKSRFHTDDLVSFVTKNDPKIEN